jgi:hypothetical protein
VLVDVEGEQLPAVEIAAQAVAREAEAHARREVMRRAREKLILSHLIWALLILFHLMLSQLISSHLSLSSLIQSSCHRYPDDMGPLRSRTTKNSGLRSEPVLETRVKEYSDFLSREGIIQNGEIFIVGVKGGGLALITSLPEVPEKKWTRMNTSYKIGDTVVLVDMLLRVMQDITARPVGTADYIRNNTGKMMGRTMSLSNLILLTPLEGMSRGMLLTNEVLGQQLRVQGLDVIRL